MFLGLILIWISNSQVFFFFFSGKLEKGAVLKAICAGFEETTEPAICLSNGKCWLSFGSEETRFVF